MKPEEFLQIINDLPPDQRAAYERDLMLCGRGYVMVTQDGRYERIPPTDILTEQIANET